MKRLMRYLLILNLMMVHGLSESAAAAGAGAGFSSAVSAQEDAGQANAPGQNRVEIPNSVDSAVWSGQIGTIKQWLDKDPSNNKDALSKEDGTSILMLLIKFCDWRGGRQDLAKAIYHLIAMKPNVLIQDNIGRDVLDILISHLYLSNAEEKEIVNALIQLMIEQGANIQTLLQRARAKKDAAEQKMKLLTAKPRNPWFNEVEAVRKEKDRAAMIIDLLEKEQEKFELKTASQELVSQYLPRDIGKILAPSDHRLLAIKHAIQDGDTNKLAEALEGNKWLEIKDAAGYTPFLYAAYIGKPDMMRDLIRQGANMDAKTKDGAQAKDFGDYQKLINEERLARERKMEEEKKAKAQKLKEDVSNLFFALNPPNYTMLKNLAYRTNYANPELINVRDAQNHTPLMLAAIKGFQPVFVEFFLTNNADTSLVDDDQNTALHLAINEGHWEIANLLIPKMNQQSIEAKNKGGFTAYDLALKYADRYKDNADFQRLMEAFKKHGYSKN